MSCSCPGPSGGRCSTCRASTAHARTADVPAGPGVEWGVYTPGPLRDLVSKLAAERRMSRSALAARALGIGLYHIQKGGLFRASED